MPAPGSKAPAISTEWENLATALAANPVSPGGSKVYVAGECDSGKTTLCLFLAARLASTSAVGYVDCDPGQSTLGPPGTAGLTLTSEAGEGHPDPYLRYVGGTSPAGHSLQLLVCVGRLAAKAAELGARWIVLDSCGFVEGVRGREFQFQMIDLLQPDHIVALRGNRDLERLLRNFSRRPGLDIRWVHPSPLRTPRGPQERREYRRKRLGRYFQAAEPAEIPLSGVGLHGLLPDLNRPETYRSREIAFCDRENWLLGLGILLGINARKRSLSCLAPPFPRERLASIQFGTLRLGPGGEELPGGAQAAHSLS